MIAKGKDAADLFPAVVKNVVSKNMEVKKLVYVYLMRYAEEQQDLALLSIATFQRGLKVKKPLLVPTNISPFTDETNDVTSFSGIPCLVV